MYLTRTPAWLQRRFPRYTWRGPAAGRVLYLTFDDGPVPEATPWVLDTLRAYGARGTFFCVGDNVRKYPELFRRLRDEGHAVGNHTAHHLDGWKTSKRTYLADVEACAARVPGRLFRPPYGRLRPGQARALHRDYRVVMWDVLSGDFDRRLDGVACATNVTRHARPGSIVVFHDSRKARPRLTEALPRVLDHFAARGYRFAVLSPE